MSPRAVPSGRTVCQSALEPGSSFPFSSGPAKVPPVSGTMRRRPGRGRRGRAVRPGWLRGGRPGSGKGREAGRSSRGRRRIVGVRLERRDRDTQPVGEGQGGALVLLHLRVRGAGGNLDLELDQELHVVLLLSDGAEWRLDPASGNRGRDADVLYAARLTALAMTASRMTLATMSGCDSIRKWEAPSTSVTVEPARSYEKRWSSGATG